MGGEARTVFFTVATFQVHRSCRRRLDHTSPGFPEVKGPCVLLSSVSILDILAPARAFIHAVGFFHRSLFTPPVPTRHALRYGPISHRFPPPLPFAHLISDSLCQARRGLCNRACGPIARPPDFSDTCSLAAADATDSRSPAKDPSTISKRSDPLRRYIPL